jgi:hypothetical protein
LAHANRSQGYQKKIESLFTTRAKLFLLVLFIFCLSIHFSLQGPNPTSRFLLTKSIVERGVFWFPEEYKEQYWLEPDFAQIDDKLYSDKAPGLSFLAIPFFILGKLIGPLIPFDLQPYSSYYPDNDIFAVIGIQIGLIILAAVGILRLYDISRLMGISERSSILSGLITAFATPYWVYARTMFAHVPAGVFLISSLFYILKYREERKYHQLILAGFFSGFGFTIEFPMLFTIPWIAVLLLLPLIQTEYPWKKRISALSLYGFITVICTIPLFYYNLTNFGDITANALSFSHWADNVHLLEPVHEGLSILLLSNDRGLIYFAPIALFGVIGLFFASRRYPLESAVIMSLILVFILFYAKKWESHGGAAFGPRYIVPILLLVGLGFGWVLENIEGSILKQGAMLTVGVWSFISTILGALYAVLIFTPVGEGDPIFDEALPRLIIWDTNAPILRQFPIMFVTLALFALAIFITGTLTPSSTKSNTPKDKTDYERVEAYSIFVWGNFLFIVAYFTQLCYILSATYIKEWEKNTGEIFLRELPPSDLWIIVICMILALHSLFVIYRQYSSQITDLSQKLVQRMKK